MTLNLTRIHASSKQTRGVLDVYLGDDLVYSCVTLELAWRDNQSRVSCIPPGRYPVKHRSGSMSASFDYPHLQVREVPERSYILIHRGNYYSNTAGCILVGRQFADINEDSYLDVASSTLALYDLVEAVEDPAILTVENLVDEYREALQDPQELVGLPPEELRVKLRVPGHLKLAS